MAIQDRLGKWLVKNLGDQLAKLRPGKKKEIPLQGRTAIASFTGRRRFDLPIDEIPVRNAEEARELIELTTYDRYAAACLDYAIRDVFGSSDGDDRGWTVAEDLENGDRIDPEVYEIILALKNKKLNGEYVIGGDKMHQALRDLLRYGDSFLTWSASQNKGVWGIDRTVYLPTWEMFRCEDETGLLTHYEQRLGWGSDVIEFEPLKIVQFSFRRCGKYGQSLFKQSLSNWADLKDGLMDKADAARAIGINPNIHVMPEGTDKDLRDSYEDQYEDKKREGAILDLFVDYGTEIKKLSSSNPDLKALDIHVEKLEKKMIPPGFPTYYFPEFEVNGARDLSGQPALAYMRMRNQWCGMLTTGIRQLIDIELVLKLGWEEFQRRGQYRVVFPKWKLNLSEGQDDESDLPGIEDLDSYRPIPVRRNGKRAIAYR